MNTTSKVRVLGCHPLLRAIFPAFSAECVQFIPDNTLGTLTLEIALSWRPAPFQEKLYAMGRDEKGVVVDWNLWRTNAHWDESFHSCFPEGLACALDTGICDLATKKWSWPPHTAPKDATAEQIEAAKKGDAMWKAFAEKAPLYGLISGYTWKNKTGRPLDASHFQLNLGPWKAKALVEEVKHMPEKVIEGTIRKIWEKYNPEAYRKLSAVLLQK